MTWRGNELPPVDVLAGLDEERVALVADERAIDGALPDELGGHVVGRALELEPVDEPLRPGGVPPHELALCVVERALHDRRARQLVEVGGGADVVGVEVRHEDRRDAARRPARAPSAQDGLRVGEADARVDERPAVVAGEEIRVHVTRPSRQRQRHAADPVVELVHRATLDE